MPELRKDPILGHYVLVAGNRSQRPGAFIESPPFAAGLPCPFCAGHESETPHEVLAYRDNSALADGPNWRVRVVPNKFPAIEIGGGTGPVTDGLCQRLAVGGAHEVIIESPRHVASTSDLSLAELAEVFLAYQSRLDYWKRDSRMAYGQVFKNVGHAAGASLEHVHSQLLVVPKVPNLIAAELAGALDYYRRRGRCPFCEMVAEELSGRQRVVAETAQHFAFAPFAARLPFETWILPKIHASHYCATPREEIEDLAAAVQSVIRRLETAVGRCAYNYILHTAPFDTSPLAHYHWHIEVVPCLTKTAGFELATGWYINPVKPEEAAGRMRGD